MQRFLALILILVMLPAAAWAQRVQDVPPPDSSFLQGGAPKAPVKHHKAVVMPAPQQPSMVAAPPQPSFGMRDRIAAIVNDNVISTGDITERMKLALLSSGLPPTQEVEQQILPQILHALIDEQLQMQEAKRLGITVPKEDIDKSLERIAKENNIQGNMLDYVKSHGASPEALEQQVRGGVSWNKVVQRELRSQVDVGDDEVDAIIARMKANAGKEEFLVSEIFLPVNTPKEDEQVKQVADNLVAQIKHGANFAAVARQFSQGTGAASGGDIGWIQEGQLPQELNHALVTMQKGDINGPIRTSSGYHLLGLRDKRTIAVDTQGPQETTLDLQQAFRPFDTAAHDSVLKEADQLRTAINGCANLQSDLTQKFPNWHWQSLGTVKQNKLPSWLADKVRDAGVGKGSEPIVTDKGALVVFVCERHVPESKIDRDAIFNNLGNEKLELQARRLMRDLRRAAYIDIRLGKPS